MSKNDEVIEDIDILLENSTFQQGSLVRFDDGVEFTPDKVIDGILDSNESVHFVQSQAVAISKIFFQQNKTTQSQIKTYLLKQLDTEAYIAKTVAITFFLIGSIDDLVDYTMAYYNKSINDWGILWIMESLNYFLFYSWDNFNKPQVKKIRSWAKETISFSNTLGDSIKQKIGLRTYRQLFDIFGVVASQTNLILTKDVEKRIELGFNPEINEDEQKLKEEFSKFGFSSDLSETLEKIDQRLSTSKDPFDFKATMDLLRSFTERLYRSILDQYGDAGKKVHDQDSEEVAKFFVSQGLVNVDFGKMIASQRHFISNTASHRIKSREEDARLSKNMVIEMSLYILRRLQNN